MQRLSILYTVYNQSEVLRQQLDKLVQLSNNEIEIVISDDNSTEDIYNLIESYNDTRIKYYRNQVNLGHDRNILAGIKRCHGEYVFLFRTKDSVLTDNLDEILMLLSQNEEVDIFFLSAVDEHNNDHLVFEDSLYGRANRENSKLAFFEIPAHPSGVIYKKNSLDFEKYEKYLTKGKFDFTIHQLIKMDMSMTGSVMSSSLRGWVYYNTLSQMDVAENSTKDGKNVYSPEYSYPRARTIIKFAINENAHTEKRQYYKELIKYFYYDIAYLGIIRCEDYRYAIHYNAEVVSYNMVEVIAHVHGILDEEFNSFDKKTRRMLLMDELKISLKLLTFYQIKRYIRRIGLFILRKK